MIPESAHSQRFFDREITGTTLMKKGELVEYQDLATVRHPAKRKTSTHIYFYAGKNMTRLKTIDNYYSLPACGDGISLW
ncbi:hypothetical protein OAB57_01110 [Bacteriovoracaceae bacterium]|nr:hypothetical protein [Bacteriovoracaceae bacterium]